METLESRFQGRTNICSIQDDLLSSDQETYQFPSNGDTVYFIQKQTPGASIKIGYSRSLRGRWRNLQKTGSSSKLRLVCAIRGDAEDEAWLHDYFGDANLRGEWFCPKEPLVNFINGLGGTAVLSQDLASITHSQQEIYKEKIADIEAESDVLRDRKREFTEKYLTFQRWIYSLSGGMILCGAISFFIPSPIPSIATVTLGLTTIGITKKYSRTS